MEIHAKTLSVEQFRGGMNQLKMNCIFTFGATGESLSVEERYFVGNSVCLMDNAVNSAFGNWLSGLKGRLFVQHAKERRFYQNCHVCAWCRVHLD